METDGRWRFRRIKAALIENDIWNLTKQSSLIPSIGVNVLHRHLQEHE